MDRWSSWALAALLLGSVALLVTYGARPPPPPPSPGTAPSLGPAPSSAPSTLAESPASPPTDTPDPGPAVATSVTLALPADAPASVRLGVIQFGYRGAELAPNDAPSRAVALTRARNAIEAARDDFARAVALGDPGSSADVGNIPQGVLEPAIERAVFTMSPNSLHEEPLDTPRGFWVVRRLR